MPEDYSTYAAAPGRNAGGTLRTILGATTVAFLAGAALVGWAAWDGRLSLLGMTEEKAAVSAPTAAPGTATTTLPAATGQLDQQIAALEARLARIDLQAAAAEGSTARAEAMLVALAARRSIERGEPLGYIEEQLRMRFGTARPSAVNAVVAAAKEPVTLAALSAQLDGLGPALAGTGPEDNAFGRFRRQIGDLLVVHRDAPGANTTANRIGQAQLLLRGGQIEAAIEVVNAMPGGKAAEQWAARARRYDAAMKALDQIEQAALAEPEKLRDGSGEDVRQPGPAATPSSATASPSTPSATAAREATF